MFPPHAPFFLRPPSHVLERRPSESAGAARFPTEARRGFSRLFAERMVERTGAEEALLRAAFEELLAAPEPVAIERLAQRLDLPASELRAIVAGLAERGWVRRDETGAVVGARGLSIEPTRHELDLDGVRRFTWCAYDTLGIFGALRASGMIRSRTPLGEPVELEVVDGRPTTANGVVLFFPHRRVSSMVDEWCPLANFFLGADAAQAWATEHGVEGEVLTLTQASERGAADWRDCCPEGGLSENVR